MVSRQEGFPVSNDNDTLGIKEIASELGCCEQTVRRYHAKGLIPSHQIGGKYSPIKMSRVDLRNFMKKKMRGKR
nr:helix-turn-helix domain-containing protein [Agrobacterium vitis]